ncbi:MAG: hypothetical protein ACU0CX_08265, partial [Sagittula sp.]|uniref:hypothetical protein n=1 Tax=Sagittula sp. TaxID=2038081 RepID=UPI00405A3C2A
NGWVADLRGQDTAARLGKVGGRGSDTPKDPGPWEREQRNRGKPPPVAGTQAVQHVSGRGCRGGFRGLRPPSAGGQAPRTPVA